MNETQANGYTYLGQLWRNTLTNLTGGLVDVMGISQHNREIKAAGGSTSGALLSSIGSAVVAGQNQFLGSLGNYGSTENSIKTGAINEYLKKYFPLLVLGVGVVVFGLIKILKRK